MATRNGYNMAYIHILFIYLLFIIFIYLLYLFIYCIHIWDANYWYIFTYTSPTKNAWELMLAKQWHKPAMWNDGLCHP